MDGFSVKFKVNDHSNDTESINNLCQISDWQFRLGIITENRRLPAVTFAAGYMIAVVFIERRGKK